MALLKHATTGRQVPLSHRTLVGRSLEADLRIDDKRVSAEHATLVWTDGLWEVKDLASRNGTVVAKQRLKPGVRVPLTSGTSIHFGSPQERWILEDTAPPDIVAVNLDTEEIWEGEHGHIELGPQASVSTEDGKQYWFVSPQERIAVADRQVVTSDTSRFRICLPPEPKADTRTVTADGLILREGLTLHFKVSPDEEHVQITLIQGDTKKQLRPRSFDYMLLALARQRLADEASEEAEPSERGWWFVDELAHSLGTDVGHVNVDIYRARRRFAGAGLEGADEMIERRTSTKTVRLSHARIIID